LDDLLTIREEEIEKLRDLEKGRDKKGIAERDQMISELEKKIKHLEKKHDKQIAKM
jgi:hypothetical protein